MIATCSHDTGEAVAAVPAQGDDWAYLSSGTWSLIGVELPEPLINEESRAHNFTNEAGTGERRGSSRISSAFGFSKNRDASGRNKASNWTMRSLTAQANEAEPFRSLINPNAARFAKSGDMPALIAAYCRETGQPPPETRSQVAAAFSKVWPSIVPRSRKSKD